MQIRIVGLSSSPRHCNTEFLVRKALESAKSMVSKLGANSGISAETELVSLAGKRIRDCVDCKGCVKGGTLCVIKDDWLSVIDRLRNPAPHGLIIGSPVYFFSTNSRLRAFMERCTCLFKKCWNPDFPIEPPDWSKTAAGAISVGFHRHGGQEHAASNIVHWLLTTGFVVVGSASVTEGPVGYIGGAAWSGVESGSGEAIPAEVDRFGIRSVELLGENVGATALRLAIGDAMLMKGGGV